MPTSLKLQLTSTSEELFNALLEEGLEPSEVVSMGLWILGECKEGRIVHAADDSSASPLYVSQGSEESGKLTPAKALVGRLNLSSLSEEQHVDESQQDLESEREGRQDELTEKRKQAEELFDDLVKRGKKLEAEAKTQLMSDLPELKFTDKEELRREILARLERARESFDKLKAKQYKETG